MFPRLIHPHEGIIVPEDIDGGSGHHNHKGDLCLVLTADPKPRLRWTQDLHERFVDAVTQLGGPSSKYYYNQWLFPSPLWIRLSFNFCGVSSMQLIFSSNKMGSRLIMSSMREWVMRNWVTLICLPRSRNNLDAFSIGLYLSEIRFWEFQVYVELILVFLLSWSSLWYCYELLWL